MNQIQELREKRAKAWDAAKAFLDTKRGTDGLLSAEDVATYEKMETDVVNLGKEIDRLERQAALDAELNKPTADPLTNKPAANGMDTKSGRASDEYKRRSGTSCARKIRATMWSMRFRSAPTAKAVISRQMNLSVF